MSIMSKLPIIFITLLLSLGLYADDNNIFSHPLSSVNQKDFNVVQKLLASSSNLKGNFQQTRYIKLLSSPLTSSGTFSISQTGGLTWNQTQPFSSKLTVTDNKIEQQMQDAPPTIMTKEKQPIIFSFTKIFLSIFEGNTKVLETYFNVYFNGNSENWQIALKPKNSPLDKAFTSIKLQGKRYLSSVTINEVKGNKLVIKFTNVKPSSNK
ncbi:MAG: hypothetical protein ACJA0H_000445 [Francisellaceae bacterium]|jgi:hypothetical protein